MVFWFLLVSLFGVTRTLKFLEFFSSKVACRCQIFGQNYFRVFEHFLPLRERGWGVGLRVEINLDSKFSTHTLRTWSTSRESEPYPENLVQIQWTWSISRELDPYPDCPKLLMDWYIHIQDYLYLRVLVEFLRKPLEALDCVTKFFKALKASNWGIKFENRNNFSSNFSRRINTELKTTLNLKKT